VKRSDITDREALEACWGYGKPSGSGGLTVLMQAGYPQKVAERKLEQLVDRGWLDYGVSIGFPWRTPEGEAELDKVVEA
jgi:hypothetical protein